ncbi:hypothetical protein ATO49_01805 [Mycolicibacterium fortuitum subsp. fortuitum DSM 46621 = ATCC 6841 = JCM 6387]|nr:hypothetical protein ATO49_01805 [Mycolicibacterium fortuitum subsp. fortuitum DSM 46621 = ATCC 6841 = JCM 6387]
MSHSGRLKAQRELAALDTLPHLTQAVVHGDLGAENVVWVWQNGMPHLSGILDWDDVALGWLTTAETASGRMEFIRADAQRNRDRIG